MQRRAKGRGQGQVTVAEVEDHDSTGTKLPEVGFDRLPREQVHRHRVGAERVEKYQIILAGRSIRDAEPPVAHDYVDGAADVPEMGEQSWIPRDPFHARVDLVESPALAGSCV